MLPFSLVTALFFLWGIPNNLNDVLIRQFMTSFSITRFQAGLVQSAFYLGYFLLALPAALLMRRLGYKAGFIIGLMLFGGGSLLFWPAAIVDRYSLFLIALFVIAGGLAFLETAANPFVVQVGDSETAERRLTFCQAFNPIGSMAGVLMGTIFIFSGIELTPNEMAALKSRHAYAAYLQFETLRVVKPYLALGALVLIWAILIWRTKFPVLQEQDVDATGTRGRLRDLLHQPHFLWAIVAQFLYVGAQVGTWSYFIQYVELYVHQPERFAGYFLTGTLAAFCIGRFISAYCMRFISPRGMLAVWSLINVLLAGVGTLAPGWVGVWAIFLTSFFMSLMYPTIFALGIKGLGANTKVASSLIVMAISGGAVLTPAMGLLSERTHSLASAYFIPLGAYVGVGLYAIWGAKIRGGDPILLPASSEMGAPVGEP
jgi:FHS family L-fucose permease-like MFS transporter